MRPAPLLLSLSAVLAALACAPALASGSASSAASDSVSVSIGASSVSIEKSSDASSGRRDRVAEGDWRVVAIDRAGPRAGTARLTLRPLAGTAAGAGDNAVVLVLPLPAVDRAAVAVGATVGVRHRPYGLALTLADEPFFLVLDDAAAGEVATRVVTL